MKGVVSGLVAFCVATLTSIVFGYLCAGLLPATARLSLLVGALAGAWTWIALSGGLAGFWRQRGAEGGFALDERQPVSGLVEWGVISMFILFALRAFCWLIFWKNGEVQFISTNNLGDLSLHLTYINYLANGAPFWPENPIYAGTGLHYPYGVDLFNALLNLGGVSVVRGLVWVGLLASAATAVTLRRWGGPFAMAAFLFTGGIAGFAIFTTMHWNGGNLQIEFDDYLDHYTNPDGSSHPIAWKSIPLALFITQRGLLYAIPAGLTLLWSWRARFFRGQRGLPFPVELLLYATMPLFHLHSFIFLSMLLGFWGAMALLASRWPHFLKGLVREPKMLLREVAKLIAWAFVPATILVWLLTGFNSGSTIHWKAGWMQDEPFFLFWFRNFGFLPICVAALFVWLWFRRSTEEAAELAMFAVPSVLFFLVTCFVMFAPWEWDNTKLMIWCFLTAVPALWAMLRQLSWGFRAGVCVALFLSGFVSLLGGLDSSHQGYSLADRSELDSVAASIRGIPVTATFACFPVYNHPLLVLGHKVVAGYLGHLGSHGIDYKPRKAELDSLLNGEPGWEERARALKVDYLFWGTREQKEYANSSTPWRSSASQIAAGQWGALFDLRGIKAGAK